MMVDMQKKSERGYAALIGILITVAIIGFLYTYYNPSRSKTPNPSDTAGGSTLEQNIDALESAKALQDVSAKRAAEINAQMQ